MTVWGIARVKDEADVIEATVVHMLGQVDQVLVADNGSSDGTSETLAKLARKSSRRLHVVGDTEVAYYQARAMTNLAAVAYEGGARWVVPFDADEIWYSPHAPRIADYLADLDERVAVVAAPLFDQVRTAEDRENEHPFFAMEWRRREPAELPKVAARACMPVAIAQGNHDAEFGYRQEGGLVVRHYPYRSLEQFERKVRNGAAAYAATDLPLDIGAHWRGYGEILENEGTLAGVFDKWFFAADPHSDSTLILDPCPR